MKSVKIILSLMIGLAMTSIKVKHVAAKSYSKVTYIDVGEGDATLIQTNHHNVLIDAGYGEGHNHAPYKYLKRMKISQLDGLILTHPHPDHIDDATTIIRHLQVKKAYMSYCASSSHMYQELMITIKAKHIPLIYPQKGQKVVLGNARLSFIGVGKDGHDVNDHSLIMNFDDTRHRFYFGGDAGKAMERKLSSKNMKCDVLKLSHHGSRSATSYRLLNNAHARYAVLSCGQSNPFFFPNVQTLRKLMLYNIPLMRTDQQGTIVCVSNKRLHFSVQAHVPEVSGVYSKNMVKQKIPAKGKDPTCIKMQYIYN